MSTGRSEKTKLNEGKTKIIWDDEGNVLIESKNDITAGDGAKRDVLDGKGVYSNTTTSNVFRYLDAMGVCTHFIETVDETTFRARRVQMIPIELVARRIATGSYLKRRPLVTEGTVFEDLVIEFFEKDDANHDPLLIVDLVGSRLLRFRADRPLGTGFIDEELIATSRYGEGRPLTAEITTELASIVARVFTLLEQAWAKQGVALVDLKIECGWDDSGDLMVADVIDNDSWRIWPSGDKTQMRDKQVYRDLAGSLDPAAKARELGNIKRNYAWVAQTTEFFGN